MTAAGSAPVLLLRLGGAELRLDPRRSWRVGRGPDNDVRVRHRSVSEHHCLLRCEDTLWWIEDLDSTNGTWMQEDRVGKAALSGSHRLRLGAVEIDARVQTEATPPALAAAIAKPPPSGRGRREPTFAEAMADELRRTPWLALSLVVHGVVFLLLAWLLDTPAETPRRLEALTIAEREEAEELAEEAPPEEQVEVEALREEVELAEDPLFEHFAIPDPEPEPFEESFEPPDPGLGDTSGWQARVQQGDAGVLERASVGGGGFRETVSKMRESGLEIVFVFDSTGSMGRVLDATKRSIAGMVDTLHALVPDARIGVVTYRDKGREDYVTRGIGLGHDVYRAMNFVHGIEAGGGGDRPEAVLEGMEAAFEQPWKPGSRRCVVLIGDAPARHTGRVEREVRRFARDENALVHTIVTPARGGHVPSDTLRSFQDIASAGGGACVTLEDEQRVLQQVLGLAFGREFTANVEEAARLVGQRRHRLLEVARRMVERADVRGISRHLRRVPVHDDLVEALATSRTLAVAELLVDVLQSDDYPESGRQAAAWALQRILGLHESPVDAEHGGPISGRRADALRAVARGKLAPRDESDK